MDMRLDMSKKDQIAQFVRGMIRSNAYPAGKRIESVRKLAGTFAVSLKIVVDALDDLEREGLVRREAGRGVFVESGKKLLLVFVGDSVESPYHYFAPGADERAMERRVKIERLTLDFIRSNADNKNLVSQLKRDYFGVLYDGYYLLGHEPEVKLFKATGLPVVMPHSLTGDNQTTPFLAIHPDFKAAFSDGVRHLRGHGHRRVATLTFGTCDAFRGHTRAEYLEFLEGLGCDGSQALLAVTKYSEQEIGEATRALMSGGKPPTALMCVSDFFAMHALKALHAMGLKVPGDVSVMGFCGYPGGAALDPPLSSVDLLYHEAGRLAVDMACQTDAWLGAEAPKREILTPHRIIERESVKNIKERDGK